MPTFNINTHGFKEMWSYYLFGNYNAPTGKDLLEESIIRSNGLRYNRENGTYDQTDYKPETITISAKDFMTDGAGKYVNGANSSGIRNFMNESLDTEYLIKLAENSKRRVG